MSNVRVGICVIQLFFALSSGSNLLSMNRSVGGSENLTNAKTLCPGQMSQKERSHPKKIARVDYAISSEDVDSADSLDSCRYYLNSVDNNFNKALIVAVQDDNVSAVKFLMSRGARVNFFMSEDYWGLTALTEAVDRSSIELIQLLIEAKDIDVNQSGSCGMTPLMRAAEKGRVAAVSLLLKASDIDVNRASEFGKTSLMYAAENGHAEIVALLLGVPGINVNQPADYGMTALMYAASVGHVDVVDCLLQAAAIDIDKAGDFGKTALTYAVENGHTLVVDHLNFFKEKAIQKAQDHKKKCCAIL